MFLAYCAHTSAQHFCLSFATALLLTASVTQSQADAKVYKLSRLQALRALVFEIQKSI
jgi:hypothetical protein